MINPRLLKAFVAVARTGSVARSSGEIHRAQSAVTRSIKELEAGLSVPLFERRSSGMLLTEFGKTLLARTDSIFSEMELAKAAFSEACGNQHWNPHAPVFFLGMGKQRLLVFCELMKQCHMGAVADSFGISQPAVSQALRDVEQGIGVALVSRTAAGMAPNELGRLLAQHLGRALSEISKAEEEIASMLHGIAGHIVVGTLSLGRNRLLPRAIIQLTQAHPNLTVTTVEGTFEHLASLLRAADIDFIIGGIRPIEHMIGLTAESVVSDSIVLLVRAGHPFTEIDGLDLTTLAEARWILPKAGTWTRSSLEAALRESRLGDLKVTVETADIAITRGLLTESDLVTAASPHLFQHEIETGELIALPFALSGPPRDIGIIQRQYSKPSTAALLLMEAIRDIHLL